MVTSSSVEGYLGDRATSKVEPGRLHSILLFTLTRHLGPGAPEHHQFIAPPILSVIHAQTSHYPTADNRLCPISYEVWAAPYTLQFVNDLVNTKKWSGMQDLELDCQEGLSYLTILYWPYANQLSFLILNIGMTSDIYFLDATSSSHLEHHHHTPQPETFTLTCISSGNDRVRKTFFDPSYHKAAIGQGKAVGR